MEHALSARRVDCSVQAHMRCSHRTVLNGTVAVNPGHLSRGIMGGTYALVEVHPIKEGDVGDYWWWRCCDETQRSRPYSSGDQANLIVACAVLMLLMGVCNSSEVTRDLSTRFYSNELGKSGK